MQPRLPNPAPLPPNLRLGDYLLEKMLARGGFGFTYLAVRLADMQRVVIKENFPCLGCSRAEGAYAFELPEGKRSACKGGEEWSARNFRNEVLALRQLQHPGVAEVLDDFHVPETGTDYYVMPYYPGGTLLEVVNQLREPRREWVLYVAAALMDVLEHIHGAGIIHRDIKPENVVFTAEGVPVLLDFGASRLSDTSRFTRVVSKEYSPREQREGAKQGSWTDIYALGATLYFAITGDHVPESVSRSKQYDPYVPLAAQEEPVKRYGERFLKSIDKALSVEPSGRYSSVRQWEKYLQFESGFRKDVPVCSGVEVSPPDAVNSNAVQMHLKSAPTLLADSRQSEKCVPVLSEKSNRGKKTWLLSILLLLSLCGCGVVVSGLLWPGKTGYSALELNTATPGMLYKWGLDSEGQNMEAAQALYKNAAEAGNPRAQIRLGELAEDEAEAFNWFRMAAEQRDAQGRFHLARCYEHGRGVPKNVPLAVRSYELAAEQGVVPAMMALGKIFHEMQNLDEAEKWYRLAAQKDNTVAHEKLKQIEQERREAEIAAQLKQVKAALEKEEYSEVIEKLKDLAGKDVAEAQFLLGECYHYGNGMAKNLDEAEKWYSKAVTLGYERADARLKDIEIERQKLKNDAALQMAREYLSKKEYESAVTVLKPMAKDGVSEAQYLLAECYELGRGVTKNEDEALAWYHQSADQMNGLALYKLADKYQNGVAGEKNKAKADELFRMAIPYLRLLAEQGRGDAQQALGMCLSYGYGVQMNDAEAVKWHRRAAKQDCGMSQYMLGRILYHGTGTPKSEKEAIYWYRKAAEQGIVPAQYQLGKCCFESEDDEIYNLVEAEKWLKKAAESGVCEYQEYLGEFYEGYEEFVTTKGLEKAAVWYEKAANQGSMEAAKKLAFIHLNGGSRLFTHAKALHWLTVAAEKGDLDCQFQLGCCYDEGIGCKANRKKAREWWSKAAAQGYNEAIDALKSKKK